MINNREGIGCMRMVRTYYFPESHRVVGAVNTFLSKHRELYLVGTSAQEGQEMMGQLKLKRAFDVPATAQGTIDLDNFHRPVIEHVIDSYKDVAPGLGEFPYQYATTGSSEPLFAYMNRLQDQGITDIYVLKGEYEGYEKHAKEIGIQTHYVDLETTPLAQLPKGHWFISNPSSRDGNIIPNETILQLCERGDTVALDLAYATMTEPYTFAVSHPRIAVVAFSINKPYGLFHERIGFAFSREALTSPAYKDNRGLLIAATILDRIGSKKLYGKYQTTQQEIIEGINTRHNLSLRRSDVVLLAHLTEKDSTLLNEEQKLLLQEYLRDSGYRICLTPLFEQKEKK